MFDAILPELILTLEVSMTYCGKCGGEIDERTDIPADARMPCPRCGSTSRSHGKDIRWGAPHHAELVAHKDGIDGTQAVRVTDSQTRSSSVDLDTAGRIISTVAGSGPQGEGDTLDVCRILAQRLNSLEVRWKTPIKPVGIESGVDCILTDGHEELLVQVTRSVADQGFWRELATSGSATMLTTIERAADDLLGRARDKASKAPKSQLSQVVLAIDATDTAGYALQAVIKDFQKQHKSELQKLGFKAVWVVGPTSDLTARLDR